MVEKVESNLIPAVNVASVRNLLRLLVSTLSRTASRQGSPTPHA